MGWEIAYPAGCTPSLDEIWQALRDDREETGDGGAAFACKQSPGPASGYPTLECTVAGLVFHIVAIGEWNRDKCPPIAHAFGLDPTVMAWRNGISVGPGPDIAAVTEGLPLVRAGAAIVRRVLEIGDPVAVVWRPIGSMMEKGYFTDMADEWLQGGAFPALGLASFRDAPDGGLHSHGLTYFTGQELRLVPAIAEQGDRAVALGAGLVEKLVEHGALKAPIEVRNFDGRKMRLAPSANGRFVVADWDD